MKLSLSLCGCWGGLGFTLMTHAKQTLNILAGLSRSLLVGQPVINIKHWTYYNWYHQVIRGNNTGKYYHLIISYIEIKNYFSCILESCVGLPPARLGYLGVIVISFKMFAKIQFEPTQNLTEHLH